LPAVPDNEEPGAGEGAYGVGVVVAAGAGSVVQVGGPWVAAGESATPACLARRYPAAI
jgi:hypothetical protein